MSLDVTNFVVNSGNVVSPWMAIASPVPRGGAICFRAHDKPRRRWEWLRTHRSFPGGRIKMGGLKLLDDQHLHTPET